LNLLLRLQEFARKSTAALTRVGYALHFGRNNY
jgi:hypothetical protein